MAAPSFPRDVTRKPATLGRQGVSRLRAALPPWAWLRWLWRLTLGTVAVSMRYRVTGLAAEAAFFALLSLPPLVLGLVASIGFLSGEMGANQQAILDAITDASRTFLTADSVNDVIVPTLTDVLVSGSVEILSIGFLLSLWSGSRALNVYLDTISIMYGLSGFRGIVRTRALSFSLYILALILGAPTVPLVLVGPQLLGQMLGPELHFVLLAYWPLVTLLTVASLTTLYHVSAPIRSRWLRDVPGAVLALVLWLGASFVLRAVISASVGSPSIYGPLAAPIVVLIWLYALSIAVLIGAALNATVDALWPDRKRRASREARLRRRSGSSSS